MKRLLVLVSILGLVLAGCGGDDDDGGDDTGGTPAADGAVITIKDLAFSGATSAEAGTTVTVKNEDGTAHTFTPDDDGDFEPVELDGGEEGSVEFAEAGTFAYHCEIHGGMKGSIEITA